MKSQNFFPANIFVLPKIQVVSQYTVVVVSYLKCIAMKEIGLL